VRRNIFSIGAVAATVAGAVLAQTPRPDAAQWMRQAAAAMGGEAALRTLKAVEVSGIAVWYQREQSERPEGPWIPTFVEFTDVRNIESAALRRVQRTRGFVTEHDTAWSSESTTLIVGGAPLQKTATGFAPAGPPADAAVLPVDLGPEHIVVAALDAPDLHAEPDVTLHGYAHHVAAFTHDGARVRVFLSPPDLLPKAIEVTRPRPFETYWAPWGDVTQRVTFGVWLQERGGLRVPRVWEYSTGGVVDGSVDITNVKINPPIAAADFDLPLDVRQSLVVDRRKVADAPFGTAQRPPAELAPGIWKVPASWDVVEVKQDDGIAILEGPLASGYSAKVIADAERRFAGAKVKAVITTSDSWPHIGGMREYVARGIPIYALDLNVPILERLFAAPYISEPDALARAPKRPMWHVVAATTIVGRGPNRMELRPLRTESGERQMMVYFPEHKLLYTSDLFTIRGSDVFLPSMVDEALRAVAREHLDVTRAFGMHYDALPWTRVVDAARPSGVP
jgi:hypothetical protein